MSVLISNYEKDTTTMDHVQRQAEIYDKARKGHDDDMDDLLDDDFEVCDNNGQYFVYYFYKHDEGQAESIHYVRVYDMLNETFNDFVIEGEAKDGEEILQMDADGNYTFNGIVLTEGNQNFHITLSGIQNLEQGVYIYSSEVKEGISSQTMVGIAEGKHTVDVSMNICFEFIIRHRFSPKIHRHRSKTFINIICMAR